MRLSDEAARLPGWRDVRNALALVTRLPLEAPAASDPRFAEASVLFPAIGLLVGVSLAVAANLLASQQPMLATLALVALWELLGAPARGNAGTTRTLLLAVLAVKVALLIEAEGLRTAALLFTPVLGRWSLVVLAVGSRNADRSGHKFSPTVTFREFGVASLAAFLFVFTLGRFVGLVLIVATGATTLCLRLAFHRWQGGVTWATVVAGMHVVEMTALAALAILARSA